MKARTKIFQRRRTLRLSGAEDCRLQAAAEAAGLSVSEYMRRNFFGGRPIIAKTDQEAIRELRRLGGLLKHSIGIVRSLQLPDVVADMRATLRVLQRAIESLTGAGRDC